MAKKDYTGLAKTIISDVGGPQNIDNLIHCITRLRFYLKDESAAKDQDLKATAGVIDVIKASGQYQVVIGNEVENVYDAVVQELGPAFAAKLDGGKDSTGEAATSQQAEQGPLSWINRLIGVITGSMTPVIGVIAAAGIIKGILALLTLPQLGALLDVKSTLYLTISAMADSAFFFLPILVGFSAARYMKGGDL